MPGAEGNDFFFTPKDLKELSFDMKYASNYLFIRSALNDGSVFKGKNTTIYLFSFIYIYFNFLPKIILAYPANVLA